MFSVPLLIDDIKNKLLYSMCLTFIILGTVGNILNIILFTKRSLRTLSPCIIFLFAASIANIIDIYSYVLLRALYGFQITPAYYSSVTCKIQIYMYYTSFCTSSWFMVGCCADRFFSSSHNAVVRRYSNIRTTRRTILVITIIISLVYSQVLYCYDANQPNKPTPCYLRNNVCDGVDLIYYFIFQSIGPSVCMFIFGIGTFIHIRRRRQIRKEIICRLEMNIIPIIRTNIINTRKGNRNILPMIVAQTTLYIFCSLPLLTFKIYSNISVSIMKSDIRLSIENLILNISIILSFVDKTFAFYIYTLTSEYFRIELIKLINQCCRPHHRIHIQN